MTATIQTLAVAVLIVAAPAGAQSLPDWAEPSGPTGPSPPAMMAPPDPPESGGGVTQVPVDGGLGLLALAGGAYAVRRLRRRQS